MLDTLIESTPTKNLEAKTAQTSFTKLMEKIRKNEVDHHTEISYKIGEDSGEVLILKTPINEKNVTITWRDGKGDKPKEKREVNRVRYIGISREVGLIALDFIKEAKFGPDDNPKPEKGEIRFGDHQDYERFSQEQWVKIPGQGNESSNSKNERGLLDGLKSKEGCKTGGLETSDDGTVWMTVGNEFAIPVSYDVSQDQLNQALKDSAKAARLPEINVPYLE